MASPVVLFSPYWVTNHWHVHAPSAVGLTQFDHAIPFLPAVTPVYLLLFPLMVVAMLCMRTQRELRQWMLAAACCCWVVALVFVWLPTELSRPVVNPDQTTWLYQALIRHDHPRNISPSLHGTFAFLSAATIGTVRGWKPWGILAMALSGIIILATIAVRQHGILDLFSGTLIGVVVWRWWIAHRDQADAASVSG